MNRASEHLLAGAAFAGDENGGIVPGHSAGQLEQIPHGAALEDHEIADGVHAQGRAQGFNLAAEPLPLLGLPHGHDHFVRAERLREIVVRPLMHGAMAASSLP
jgi:hypothetical protein